MNKEEILKDITRHFGIDNEPQEENAMFILPDGEFMYTDLSPEIEDEEEYGDFDDSLISQHNNVDEYIIYKGYAKESNKKPSDETLFQSMFNAIRFQIFDEDVSYLALPTNPPTSSQYDSILKVLDLAENWVGSIEICGSSPSSRGIRYSFDDYTPDEVLKKIKRYYASGILYEDVNVEMSSEFDNEGNELTKEQVEFFKNSKIRDRSNKLLVCYHNTPYDFKSFDKSKIGSGNGGASFGKGFYFSIGDNLAGDYEGDYQIVCYLNITNPFDYYNGGCSIDVINKLLSNSNYKYHKDWLERIFDKYEISDEDLEEYSKEEIFEGLMVDYDLIDSTLDDILIDDNPYEVFSEMVKNAGYDGIVAGEEVVAFESNQIKLITNKTPTNKDEMDEDILNESLKLDEATRNQLINKTKNSDNYKDQSKGKNRWDRRTKSRIANSVAQYNKVDMDALFKRDILTLGVDVHGETDDYVVTIRFIGLLKEVQREVKANKGKLEYKVIARAMSRVFNSGDVSLHCTCPDFKYRQSYNASKQNYGTQYEPRPSNITNPNDTKGGGCKHCMLVLSNLDWMMKVSSVINNYIKYCQNNLEYNYATYIFPKVYGVPYKQAVQQSLFDNGGYLASDQKTVGDIAKRNLVDKDDKGKFIVGNKYRFNKKQNGELEEPNEDQLKFNFDEKPKEVVPDENNINK